MRIDKLIATESSEAQELQARIERLERELDHAQRLASLGMVLGIIAHEFNNILTPILSYSQLAIDNPGDPELTAKALRRAADGAEKAARIASSVLTLARKDGYLGQDRDQVARADVAHCYNEALQCLAMDRVREGLELTTSIPQGCTAAMDPVALQQVFVNLLLNARKSLRGMRGRIELRVSRGTSEGWCSAGNGGGLIIEIEDSGRGMDPDILGRIFDPFVSASDHESKSPQRLGTGLGLTICRRLIESAGGTITATSVVGEGSCFRINLESAAATDTKMAA